MNGQIAVKFEVSTPDTIRGISVMFAKANASFDDISFNIYLDNNGIPGAAIEHDDLPLIARRLYAKHPDGAETFVGTDRFVRYEFRRPIRLEKNKY
jgi:hypothetical protein